MTMLKRTMLLLGMLVLATAFAMPVKASNGPRQGTMREAYVRLDEDEKSTYVYIGSDVDQSRKGMSYNANNNTLTLTDFQSTGKLYVFAMGDDFSIELKGVNSLGRIEVSGDDYGGNITLKGNGKLSVNRNLANRHAIYINSQNTDGILHVCKSVSLNLYGNDHDAIIYIQNTDTKDLQKVIQIDGRSMKPIRVKEKKQYLKKQKRLAAFSALHCLFLNGYKDSNGHYFLGDESPGKCRLFNIVSDPILEYLGIPLYHGLYVDSREKGYTWYEKVTDDSEIGIIPLVDTEKYPLYQYKGVYYTFYFDGEVYKKYSFRNTQYGLLAEHASGKNEYKEMPNGYKKVMLPNKLYSSYEFGPDDIAIVPQESCTNHKYRRQIKKASVTKKGCCTYQCKKCKRILFKKDIPAAKSLRFSKKKYSYTGKVIKPTIKANDNVDQRMYKISLNQKAVKVGKYKVNIKLDKKFYSKKKIQKTMYVIPQNVKKINITKKGKTKVLKWQKVKGASGYQLIFYRKSNYKECKRKIVKRTKDVYKGNAEYVCIRTYQIINRHRVYSQTSSLIDM